MASLKILGVSHIVNFDSGQEILVLDLLNMGNLQHAQVEITREQAEEFAQASMVEEGDEVEQAAPDAEIKLAPQPSVPRQRKWEEPVEEDREEEEPWDIDEGTEFPDDDAALPPF